METLDDDTGTALQDVLKGHCFGCGTLNEHGLHIKSRWDGDELVCRWQPPAHYIGHPGIVYGGAIASVVDCHAVWTALAADRRAQGLAPDDTTPVPTWVTARLAVDYLQPAAIDRPLALRARATERSGRRTTVACRVMQGEVECARAEVLVVRLREA